MFTNSTAWLKKMSDWSVRFERAATEMFKEIGKETRIILASRTPVATGRASASWNVSMNTPNRAVQPATYFNPKNSVKDGKVELEGFRLGQKIWWTNALPYIYYLNHGSSKQAPAGFVEMGIEEGINKFPGIARRMKSKYRL